QAALEAGVQRPGAAGVAECTCFNGNGTNRPQGEASASPAVNPQLLFSPSQLFRLTGAERGSWNSRPLRGHSLQSLVLQIIRSVGVQSPPIMILHFGSSFCSAATPLAVTPVLSRFSHCKLFTPTSSFSPASVTFVQPRFSACKF